MTTNLTTSHDHARAQQMAADATGCFAEDAHNVPGFFDEMEVRATGYFGAISALLLAIVYIVDLIRPGARLALEERILLSMRNPADLADAIGPHYFEEIMRDITALGGIGIIAIVVIVATSYLYIKRDNRLATLFLFVLVSGMILSLILKQTIDRPRPMVVPQSMYVATASFPSGHSMLSALTYLTLGTLLARLHTQYGLRVLLVVTGLFIVIAVGISRVYLGVHWPTDVLAGWFFGAAWTLLGLYVMRRFRFNNLAGAQRFPNESFPSENSPTK